MPWKSRWSIHLPTCSLSTYLFGSPDANLDHRKPLILDGEQPDNYLTFASYREWSKRFAVGLTKAGLQTGDRVMVFSGNTFLFPAVLHGTIMAGGIFTGANPTYVAREAAYQLKDCGAKFLLVGEGNLDAGLEAAKQSGFPLDHVYVFDDGVKAFQGKAEDVQGVKTWTRLLASPSEAAEFKWEEFHTRAEQNRTAILNYSSGTTGLPKGTEITHLNYIANTAQVTHLTSLTPNLEEWRQRVRALALIPMYHAYAQTVFTMNNPRMGIPSYVMRKFDFIQMLEWVQKYRITTLSLVPPIVVSLTKRPEVAAYDLRSLELVGCGAAPLSRETADAFARRFGAHADLRQGWGMTEVTCSALGHSPAADDADDEPDLSSVGEPNPNVEAQIVDPATGIELPPGRRGELWIRGPNVMKGYWRRPGDTARTLTPEGWLMTGDVAFRDARGAVHIVDRIKELIKRKGLQIAPAELEGLLLDHPRVADAAVVGVTVDGEELPRAYVVLKEDDDVDGAATTSPREIAAWVAERVSRHKRLDGGVVVVDVVPKNPSGKILRSQLRERAKQEVGDGVKGQSKL